MSVFWNQTSTPLFPVGTVARVGDCRFFLRKSKTEYPKWRLYLEICTREVFGVKDASKRGVVVAEYPGTLELKDVQQKAEEYMLIFIGRMIQDMND